LIRKTTAVVEIEGRPGRNYNSRRRLLAPVKRLLNEFKSLVLRFKRFAVLS